MHSIHPAASPNIQQIFVNEGDLHDQERTLRLVPETAVHNFFETKRAEERAPAIRFQQAQRYAYVSKKNKFVSPPIHCSRSVLYPCLRLS